MPCTLLFLANIWQDTHHSYLVVKHVLPAPTNRVPGPLMKDSNYQRITGNIHVYKEASLLSLNSAISGATSLLETTDRLCLSLLAAQHGATLTVQHLPSAYISLPPLSESQLPPCPNHPQEKDDLSSSPMCPTTDYPGQWDYPVNTGTLQRCQYCSLAKRMCQSSSPLFFVLFCF